MVTIHELKPTIDLAHTGSPRTSVLGSVYN